MRALLVPFGYPGYPADVLSERIEESKRFLNSLDIEFESTNTVIVLEECDQAIHKAKTTDFDFVIALIASWVETPNVISVMSHLKEKPILLWSHGNMSSKDSAEVVSLGSIAAASVLRETFEELEYRFKFVVGNSFDPSVAKDISVFAKAAYTVAKMKRSRLGLFGYVSMGMQTGLADHLKVNKLLGTEIVHFDQYSILHGLEETDARQIEPFIRDLTEKWMVDSSIGKDLLEKTAAIYLRLKSIAKDHKLDS